MNVARWVKLIFFFWDKLLRQSHLHTSYYLARQGSSVIMPPKKNKIVEDKSFGMKNKKGGKAQKYLATLANAGKSKEMQAKEQEKLAKAKEKEREAQKKAEIAELFKPIMIQQKVPFGKPFTIQEMVVSACSLTRRHGPKIDSLRVL